MSKSQPSSNPKATNSNLPVAQTKRRASRNRERTIDAEAGSNATMDAAMDDLVDDLIDEVGEAPTAVQSTVRRAKAKRRTVTYSAGADDISADEDGAGRGIEESDG